MDEYLRILAKMDETEDEEAIGNISRGEVERKLQEAQERLKRYKAYRQYMEDNGLTQLSIVDMDAKLMKNKNGFMVAYNVQTAVDSETHLIRDCQMTNQPTDHGLIESTVNDLKEDGTVLDIVADKGYNVVEDMVRCLENGIVPHVILPDGQDTYGLEMPYQEADADPTDQSVEGLNQCLHAGVIPKAYEASIDNIEVVEKKQFIKDEQPTATTSIYGTEEKIMQRAAEVYFVGDPERNLVYCPAGEILRQKTVKKNGNIRYANKTACRHCKYRNQCYNGKNEWKEIDFTKDTLEKTNRKWLVSLRS